MKKDFSLEGSRMHVREQIFLGKNTEKNFTGVMGGQEPPGAAGAPGPPGPPAP